MIALFIALLGYVLRLSRVEMESSLVTFSSSFVNTFLSWLLIQYIINRNKPAWHGWKIVLAMLGCTLISIILFSITKSFTGAQNRVNALPRGIRAVYFLLLMRSIVIGGFLYYIIYLLRKAYISQQSKLENERLKQENLQAKLSLLQEQVSPHFLFNSLGTLRTMMEEKAPREFIQRLSDVYRYLLSNKTADLVMLRAELDFTLAYLHILKERFENALITEIEVTHEAYYRKLPPVTLQLLIENAVKHNIVSVEMPLQIRIYTNGHDWLVVSNSLQPRKSVSDSLGSGLSNIRERYRILAGLDISVTKTDHHFTVSIPLLN